MIAYLTMLKSASYCYEQVLRLKVYVFIQLDVLLLLYRYEKAPRKYCVVGLTWSGLCDILFSSDDITGI